MAVQPLTSLRRTILVCVIGVSALAAMLACARLKSIERHSDADEAFVEATLALLPEQVAGFVHLAFKPHGSPTETAPPFTSFRVYPMDDPAAPRDWQLQAHTEGNPALKRYLALPASARRGDFFLREPTLTVHWPSEYFWNGQAAEFRCDFIVHLAPAPGGTRVEVIEYLPTIRVGRKFGLPAHGVLPGMVSDVRRVEPTTRDRRTVLAAISEAATASAAH